MRRRPPNQQPARCLCQPGADAHAEHWKPGKRAAEHGDVFAHKGACSHSELSRTTKPLPKVRTVQRLRLR